MTSANGTKLNPQAPSLGRRAHGEHRTSEHHNELLTLAGQALGSMELQPETFKPPELNSLPNPPEGVKVKLADYATC